MNGREMGPYVLLHKLAEDALSDTYRAGLKSGSDVERVVLLCLFKTGPEDVGWIAETASVGRRALQGLESPHLANLVDSGEIDGTAFLAYDYIPGITLSGLMRESRHNAIPIPLGLALLITNRSAEGLMAAWQHESRMLHGFLVPTLVLVSNEGEVRVLGFEVASRLRRLLRSDSVNAQLGVYMAPEVVPEGQPATTDDVYSLGAILFELLTGTAPPTEAQNLDAAVAAATAVDGTELPQEVVELLSTSLTTPPRRAALKDWSENLHEIILSGRYEASSFDLAFFLNRLIGHDLDEYVAAPAASSETATLSAQSEAATIRMSVDELGPEPHVDADCSLADEIDHDSAQAIAAERDQELDGELDWRLEESAVGSRVESRRDDQPTAAPAPMLDGDAVQPTGSRRRWLAIAAALVAVLIASLGVSYYLDARSQTPIAGTVGRSGSAPLSRPEVGPGTFGATETGSIETPMDDAAAAGQTPDGQTPDGPSPGAQPATGRSPASQAATAPGPDQSKTVPVDDIDRRVQELVSKRSATIEASLRDEYAQQIAALQAELEVQRLAAEGWEAPVATDSHLAMTGTAALSSTEQPLASDGQPLGVNAAAEQGVEDEASTQALTGGGDTGPSLLPAGTQQAVGQGVDLPPQDYTSKAPSTAPAADGSGLGNTPQSLPNSQIRDGGADAGGAAGAPAAATKVGDLVEPGPGVTPPSLKESIQPQYPLIAKRLNKQAVVAVHVLVGETGKALEVELIGDEAGYGFDDAAIKAARSMSWNPATKDGVKVKMWSTLRIAFQP